MNDFRVVIDAGHGGSDPGAVSGGVNEKDLTLMISQYMYQRFQEENIPVTLIRSTDETISPTERVRRILDAYGNNPNVIVISNHINSNETGTAQGAEVIYALRNEDTLARNILDELTKEGQIARSFYQRRLPSNSSKDYYFIHRDTGVTQPVIVEYGFINNPEDLRRIQENYRNYVNAVVRAVIETEGGQGSSGQPGNNMYVVKRGDTLWSIARTFNTTVDAIKRVNNLSSDILTIGQTLVIPTSSPEQPELPGNTTVYTVQKGDSLWWISRKFNTTIETLRVLNQLTSDIITPGQILKVPTTGEGSTSTPGGTITYAVQRGDTLWLIARKYNTTVDAIKNANGLTSDFLTVGRLLQIPTTQMGPSDTYITYTVQKGDTLWSIASRYNTTVDAIKRMNAMTTDVIVPGQVLMIY